VADHGSTHRSNSLKAPFQFLDRGEIPSDGCRLGPAETNNRGRLRARRTRRPWPAPQPLPPTLSVPRFAAADLLRERDARKRIMGGRGLSVKIAVQGAAFIRRMFDVGIPLEGGSSHGWSKHGERDSVEGVREFFSCACAEDRPMIRRRRVSAGSIGAADLRQVRGRRIRERQGGAEQAAVAMSPSTDL